MKKINQLPSGENGSILIWAAVGLAVLIAFAGLATDIPYLYVARQQLQTAADAGALAGAYGLVVSKKEAVTDAKVFAGQTPIIGQLLTAVQVDVFTCNSNNGAINECSANTAKPDQVTCVTHRDVAHANPMPLFLLRILQLFGLGRTTADVSATATARILNSCSSDCFKPWSIADRWVDVNANGQFDNGIDQYGPVTTGYNSPGDNGLQVTLKVGSPQAAISSGFFYAVDFPPLNRGTPVTGGDTYRDSISTCSPQSFVSVGDQLQVEPGNMVGPTKQGVQALIDLDPTAFWDTGCGCVNSPLGADSPRLIRIAFFDPRFAVVPGRTYVTVIKVGGFFIEGVQPKGDVLGRYTQVSSQGGTPDPACSFLQTVQLVK